jgi:hypothetical protein
LCDYDNESSAAITKKEKRRTKTFTSKSILPAAVVCSSKIILQIESPISANAPMLISNDNI